MSRFGWVRASLALVLTALVLRPGCAVVLCAAEIGSVPSPGQDLPPAPITLAQAPNEPQPVSEVPSAPPPDNWTSPPLVSDSTYFGSSAYSGNGGRAWFGADVLLWAIKPGNSPALVTSGTTTSLGALGPGTTTLYDGNQNYDNRIGGRFTGGFWLDPGRTKGVEASYFFLNGPSETYSTSGDGAPGSSVLARPFVNAITGLQDSQVISFPGVSSGNVLVSSGSQLMGAELNGLCNLCCSCPMNCCSTGCCQTGYGAGGYMNQSGYRVDMIGGFRYLYLNEDLVITENITFLPTAPAPFDPGSMIMVTDRFQTRNDFYGGQIGARGEWYRGAWFTNVTGKVAIGDTHQQVRINGATTFTSSAGATVTQPGGLLALPTNMGTYSRDQFSVVPEVGINVGRQLSNNVRIYVGYTLIYWSSVVRPGDQIDPVINPTQLPTAAGPGTLVGPARPAFAFHDTDFWAQGVNIGMEFRR